MKKQISPKIVSLIFAILVICFAIAFYAFSWTGPTADPPGGNVPPPLNVSGDPQTKTGSLRLGGLSVDNDTWLATSAGNVGIGTPSPSQKLDVDGNIVASGTICDSTGCIGVGQRRVTGTCGSNQAIRIINADGSVSCVNLPASAICTWEGRTYSTGAKCCSGGRWRCNIGGTWTRETSWYCTLEPC